MLTANYPALPLSASAKRFNTMKTTNDLLSEREGVKKRDRDGESRRGRGELSQHQPQNSLSLDNRVPYFIKTVSLLFSFRLFSKPPFHSSF